MDVSSFTKREKNLLRTILIIVILFIAIISSMKFDGFTNHIIDGDGRGYYAYLPAIFIHHSLDFTTLYDFEKSVQPRDYMGHYFINYENVKINKYYAGVALLLMPFFLMAWLFSWIFGLELTGYSILFQYFTLLGSIFYCLAGLFITYKLLRSFNFTYKLSVIIASVLLLGTNLFFYTFFASSSSHVYSFFAVALFLYFSRRTFYEFTLKNILYTSIALGLIVLIRPVNGLVVLLIPFLSPDIKALKNTFIKWIRSGKSILISILPFLIIISIQFIIFYIQTGKLFIWTYYGEGFRFAEPEITNFLFSYRKGFFIYTPVMMLAVLGFIPLLIKKPIGFISGIIFLALAVYFLSSWWNWYYGDSFGMRPMIDYYPFFAILLGYFIKIINIRYIRYFIFLLFGFAIFLNLFQTYQYEHLIIHHDSMNKEKYKYVFLKSGDEYKNILGGSIEDTYKQIEKEPFLIHANNFDTIREHWVVLKKKIIGDTALSGQRVCLYDSLTQYNAEVDVAIDSNLIGKDLVFVKATLWKYDLTPKASLNALFVAQITDKDEHQRFYKSFRLTEVPSDTIKQWDESIIEFRMPKASAKDDQTKLFIWNPKLKDFYIDDVSIEFYSFLPDSLIGVDVIDKSKPKELQPLLSFTNDFDSTRKPWEVFNATVISKRNQSKNVVCLFDSVTPYNAEIDIIGDTNLIGDSNLFIKSTFIKYDISPKASENALFVAQIADTSNNLNFYKTIRINENITDTINNWERCDIEFKMPQAKNREDEIKFFIWNYDLQKFYLDSIEIKIFDFVKEIHEPDTAKDTTRQKKILPVKKYTHDFDTLKREWEIFNTKNTGDTAYSGNTVCLFDSLTQYNAELDITGDTALIGNKKLYVKATFMKYDLTELAVNNSLFVAQITDSSGKQRFYKTYRIIKIPADPIMHWSEYMVEFFMPAALHKSDKIKYFIWNPQFRNFYIDDIKLLIYNFNQGNKKKSKGRNK